MDLALVHCMHAFEGCDLIFLVHAAVRVLTCKL